MGTEHVLLALALPGTPSAAGLVALGVDTAALKARIESMCKPGGAQSPTPDPALPYTSRAKKVMELAMQEGERQRATSLDVAYLLFGLVAEERGVAAQALSDSGVTVDRARAALTATPVSPLNVRLSDDSEHTITEQIVAQIAEAIATGVLKPGDRLPTVRHLADELDIAPGTVARAYSELEQRGALQTNGARGTTVAPKSSPAATPPEHLVTLSAMLRPIVVEGFHLGATASDLREALERALGGVMLNE